MKNDHSRRVAGALATLFLAACAGAPHSETRTEVAAGGLVRGAVCPPSTVRYCDRRSGKDGRCACVAMAALPGGTRPAGGATF